MGGHGGIRISERDNSKKKEGLPQVGSLSHLPEEGDSIQANDQEIDQGEMTGTNGISDRDHLSQYNFPED